MLSNKEVKEELRKLTREHPEKFYPVNKLKELGFKRYQCSKCGRFFWSAVPRNVCGDSSCLGGYDFIGNTPARNKLSYVEVWKRFSKLFSEYGYTPIKRYPVAARWRKDTDFVQASIYDFQPYVVSGEIEPPANPLVVPQFSLRFNDINNVGLTGSHYTGFVMIGQHAFKPPEEFNQEKYFEDIYHWLTIGLGLPKGEIVFHEDAWAGGGNAGVCLEFFSRGLELGNQVYTGYKVTESGLKPLKLKVLDMGMGQERNAWFSQGTHTSYDAVFPHVMNKLYSLTGVNANSKLMSKFLPYASLLNSDEVSDVEKVWKFIANKLNYSVEDLKDKVSTFQALYSIAEHSRSLLVALNDGVLPSNVGGGYNLRLILRRALSFIKKYQWNIKLEDVVTWHAEELKELFPELQDNLNEVIEIIRVEERKFENNLNNIKKITEKIVKQGQISTEKFIELYDSHGINPESIVDAAKKQGIDIKVPDNFYALLDERHSNKKEQETQTRKSKRFDFKTTKKTKALYFDNYKLVNFSAEVLEILPDKERGLYYVILDKTAFYPTSGGQEHDTGSLNGEEVVDVFKQDNLIVHVLKKVTFKEGDIVNGNIDLDRRIQLTQHHTATHIINGAARSVLGNHIWQAGASKTVERARLDITHYEQIKPADLKKIEAKANEIVKENLKVKKYFLPRNIAEQKFGFRLYQGGAVPGKEIRIVEIPNFDVEACGGTHLDKTGEAKLIKIIKTSKIQDGIVRIEFVAGHAAEEFINKEKTLLNELSKLLDCSTEELPCRVRELFDLWKQIVKKKRDVKFELKGHEKFSGNASEIIKEISNILKTQPEHFVKTINRFLNDIKRIKGNQ